VSGYKGEIIAEWVASLESPWKIEALDTGINTQTGGRISQCMSKYPDERVFATYGDGLGNIDLLKLLDFHRTHKKKATVTAVRPPARFGVLESENGRVTHFGEKNQADAGWINGGFFILEPSVSKYVLADSEPFETGALPRLVQESELMSYHHSGFWQPMDTLREKQELVKYVESENIPWLEI
jgi:glucose-1-phosphate cytidylyltransferase